jgi:branched-chain amino acid transport system substrate-binding protein
MVFPFKSGMFRVCALFCLLFMPLAPGLSAAASGPIVIGGLFDLSGPNFDLGEAAVTAARAAVRELNETGGIGGRNVEFAVVDTFGQGDRMLAGAKTLNDQHGAAILIGPENPALNDLARRYAETYKRILFLVSGIEPMLPLRKKRITYSFSTSLNLSAEIKALFRFLRSKRISVIGAALESSGEGRRVGLWIRGFSREYGLRLACMGYFDPEVENLALRFSQLDRCSSKLNIIWADWDGSEHIWGAILGMRNPAALFHTALEPPVDDQGRARFMPVKIYGVAPAIFLKDAVPSWHPCAFQCRRFLRYMDPEELADMDVHQLLVAAQVWDAIHMAARAIEKAGSTRPEPVKEALEEKILEYRGVTGVFRPGKSDHSGLQPKSLLILEWMGRAWRPVQ